jgi:hypothetical protein
MWMFGMAASMHQCRSVGLPVHDNVLPTGGIIAEIALATMDGLLIISSAHWPFLTALT